MKISDWPLFASRYRREFRTLARTRSEKTNVNTQSAFTVLDQWLAKTQLGILLTAIILVPLVAFDAQGNRLGRGGAFYDASLASMRHRCHLKRPRLIGLAHECQRVERLDTDSWDIPLEGVLTDRRFLRAKG